MGRRRSKQRIQFSNRVHPASGLISLVMGSVALILLFVFFIISGKEHGNSGIWIGVAGIWTFLLSVVGFVLAARSYRMEDIYKITPVLGSVFNGIVVVVMLLLYVAGAM